MKWPIFIPSKGRSTSATLPRLLKSEGIPFTLVVEPNDAEAYKVEFAESEMLILTKNGSGIVFSRQSILEEARKRGLDRYWQIDDNIRAFYKTEGRKSIKVNALEALSFAEQFTESLVGLDYVQFAVFRSKESVLNKQTLCCVLTDTRTGLNYRKGTDMKEDVDFVLQHLAGSLYTRLVQVYAMGKPPMGKNKSGGLAELYKAGKSSDAAKHVQSLWPWCSTLVRKKNGWLDLRVNWKMFLH